MQSTIYRTVAVFIFIFLTILNTLSVVSQDEATVLINEVMYLPTSSDATTEWVELFNPTNAPVDVVGWSIGDATETDPLVVHQTVGPRTTIIPAGGYAVVTDLGSTLDEVIAIPDQAVRLTVTDRTLGGSGLANQGEWLVLRDADGEVIDYVEWGVETDDVSGDPALLVASGRTLSRFPGCDSGDSRTDFGEGIPTPGDTNSFVDPDAPLPCVEAPVCITELYYDTHPNVRNEFVAVCNPTSAPFDLSGWYVSDEPLEPASDQAKVLFGRGAFIPAHTTWYCTQNASWYLFETGALPTFEYYDDARADVPQLERHKTLTLSNSGGAVALHDPSGAIADVVCYGNFTEGSIAGWNGSAVEDPGQGIVLRRAWAEGVPKDTDTASDWAQPRIFHIGQSTFGAETFVCNATCIPFVSPDCSFPTIVETLRAATRSVLLNVYEFTNPWLARELLWLLHRNVSVSVLLDGSPVGGISADEETIATVLASAGASVRFLANDPSRQVFTRYRFDHAKYLVVDATTVVVMSGNWGLTGVPVDPSYGNREWGVAIVNATVASYFTTVFTEDFDPTRCDSVPLAAMNFSNASDSLRFAQNRTGDYFPRFPSPSVQGTVTITPILSPDTSETLLCAALASAKTSLYIEQLELALEWKGAESPLVCILREKAAEGVDVRVLLNENPAYEASASITVADIAAILEGYGIQVRRSTVPWSPFATLHNKGAVIDNRTVLVSSINWNANSVQRNREAAVLIDSPAVAGYYAEVFCSDWDMLSPTHLPPAASGIDYKNLCLIVLIVGVSATLVGLDWRRRRW